MNKTTKSENVKITLPITAGVDGKGQSYDVVSLYDILDSIPFDKVSINLQIDKKYVYGEEARGKIILALSPDLIVKRKPSVQFFSTVRILIRSRSLPMELNCICRFLLTERQIPMK